MSTIVDVWDLKRCGIDSERDGRFGCEIAFERVLQGLVVIVSGDLSHLLCIFYGVNGHPEPEIHGNQFVYFG